MSYDVYTGTQHRVPHTVGLPNMNDTGLLSMPHGRCDVPRV